MYDEQMNTAKTFHTYALLLAAGTGSRLATTHVKKQFIAYHGAPLWWESVKKFHNSPHIKGIVLVFPSDDSEFTLACEEAEKLHAEHNLGIPFIYAKGGEKRYQSVFCGLEALPSSCTHVLIHDSARPFFSTTLVHHLISVLKSSENTVHAVIPAIHVTDTIKVVQEELHNYQQANSHCSDDFGQCEKVEKTLKRQSLRAVQTPQAFSVQELLAAHRQTQVVNTNFIQNTVDSVNPQQNYTREITDDAMLMEDAGHTVYIVHGEANNIKITHPEDLSLLEKPIQQIPCTAYGYDVHRFGGNRPFILGGIAIPTPLLIEAHSDGDVLLHALMDALLSCMCLGDIGTHFPDTDSKYQNISSSLLLDHVMGLWKKSNLTLCHVDLTVITQKPKISPFTKEITKNIARLLSICPSCVNTKATTEEKLGFTGEGKGIKAVALVSALKTISS